MLRQFSIVLFVAAAMAVAAPDLCAQRTVLTGAFENQTGERGLDWLGEGLSILIAERLSAERRLYVFGADERTAVYERLGIPESLSVSRATSLKIGWDIGADVLVSGRFSGSHEEFRIDARVLDLDAARNAGDVSVTGRLDDVISMTASLSAKLARQLIPGSELPETDNAGQPPVPRSAFEAYIRGTISTDPERHNDLLQEAIRLYPQYPAASYQLGQSYYLDANYQASAAQLEKVSAVVPEYPLARFMLGIDYYREGDGERAEATFSQLPATYEVLINLGAARALTGDSVGAEAAWRRAAGLKENAPESLFNLAHLAFVHGDTSSAMNLLNQFLRTHGRDAEALFMLARVYERIGRTEDAERLFTQSTRISPPLERWIGAPVPNLTRVITQYDPTSLRLPPGTSLWNESRTARKAANP